MPFLVSFVSLRVLCGNFFLAIYTAEKTALSALRQLTTTSFDSTDFTSLMDRAISIARSTCS